MRREAALYKTKCLPKQEAGGTDDCSQRARLALAPDDPDNQGARGHL